MGFKRRGGDSGLKESEISIDDDGEEGDDEDEDWGEFDLEGEGDGDEDEDEGEYLPMEKMKRWLEKKPRGFGVGKKYETSVEDKLLDEIEQSWKAQAANLNKLKNDPLKPQLKRGDNLIKETQSGFRVRVTNLPRKKNVHRDLKTAFKERLSFGKVVKQIKCQVVECSSTQSVSEEIYSDTVFEELPFSGLEAVANADAVVEDTFVDSWEDSSDDDSDEDVDETEEEEDEGNRISSSVESPIELRRDSKPELRSQKQVVKREIREHEELETLVGETTLDDDDESDVEEVAEENLEPLISTMSSSDEQRVDRIRKLELKLLGRETLLGGGGDSDKPEAKLGSGVEGKKKEKKKKKKKILVKGKAKMPSSIEIPGSSKRLKVKEKALLTGVLVKYAAKAASTSNDK
ncbi:unnamed protein product [Thlaspi arvense]|uniref:Uncharacterized protein n=1 Tax=Thlaspi arvense TaxID=13288 RepID=A0AAU9SM09_THLAR|nr:unnamed protein product [Thlaspi arvense]